MSGKEVRMVIRLDQTSLISLKKTPKNKIFFSAFNFFKIAITRGGFYNFDYDLIGLETVVDSERKNLDTFETVIHFTAKIKLKNGETEICGECIEERFDLLGRKKVKKVFLEYINPLNQNKIKETYKTHSRRNGLPLKLEFRTEV